MQEDQNLLEVKDLKVYFKEKNNKKKTVKAVDGVSFSIRRGETVGLVGESGCGKSSLGRAILKLTDITDGQVLLDGTDISRLKGKALKEMRKKAQIIFQDPAACLNPRRTVRDILREPFLIHGCTDLAQADCRIEELLQMVGLEPYFISRYPHELSGGQKQRVGIARALALNPELLVCDEAVSALDVSVQAQIVNLLSDLKKEKHLTYLFISHNMSVIYHVSDRIFVMYLGQIVEIASADELYDHPLHEYTRVLMSAIPRLDRQKGTERVRLQGEPPNPTDPPSGCHFRERCPKACAHCSEERPPLVCVGGEHYVACHLVQGDSAASPSGQEAEA